MVFVYKGGRVPLVCALSSPPGTLSCTCAHHRHLSVTRVLAIIAAALTSIPFLLLNNLQLSLENPFAGEDDEDADPDDIRLDELQVMTYMSQDATLQAQLQADMRRRHTEVCPLILAAALAGMPWTENPPLSGCEHEIASWPTRSEVKEKFVSPTYASNFGTL